MCELNQKLRFSVESHAKKMFDLACDIYDHPEIGMTEVYASDLLCKTMEEYGFVVERGLADLPTAFCATYENGVGGPVIGFLGEYDALMGLGHACGHHLQTPICLAAALAVRETMGDTPYKLIVFGTPGEELGGGKAIMAPAGCFDGVDVAIHYHSGTCARVSYKSKAWISAQVVFHGVPSHASSGPEKGRSALDAMLLSFQGLEFMREHVDEGCRIHYTVSETTGPANIVHPRAVADYTLRSSDKEGLKGIYQRFLNIIEGAARMTDTSYDIAPGRMYEELLPIPTLREAMLDTLEELDVPNLNRETICGTGSTDVGNVSWRIPTVMYNTTYQKTSKAHTVDWLNAGKSQSAYESIIWGALAAAHLTCKLINDNELRSKIKSEFDEATGKLNCKDK